MYTALSTRALNISANEAAQEADKTKKIKIRNKRKGEKAVKKKFKLTDLDCANCAAKMENAIRKIEGVSDASVSFMTQKMTIEADPDRFEQIMDQVVKTCRRVEPDCRIVR